MTIVEELDKKSGRPHRSKNIVDAMKYAFGIENTPQNIAEAIKKANFNPPDEFTITFMNGETKLEEGTVEYGKAPVYGGETPTKTGYTFLGWNSNSAATEALSELPIVTGDATYYAIFEIDTYTITWKNGDTTLDTDTVDYGEAPTYTGETPIKTGYTFLGWNTDSAATTAIDPLPDVTADTTYYAIFEINTFTITWKNGDTTLDTDTVEYGATPEYEGETPTGTGIFLGWNSDSSAQAALSEIPAATADATYYAIFQA